jgi:archaellum biogenesis ATPase FlaH
MKGVRGKLLRVLKLSDDLFTKEFLGAMKSSQYNISNIFILGAS